jgi:hypothetical protein
VPTVSRLRETARRAEDLSNLRQLTVATLAYAADNEGVLPVGRASFSPPGGDDYTWTNYKTCWKPLLDRVPQLAAIPSCASVLMGYGEAHELGKPQVEYGSDDVMLGWVYWGGRDDLKEGNTVKYRTLRRIGQRLTPGSQTLWTCWCWDSNGMPSPSVCPHVGSRYIEYPPGVALKPPPDGLGIALTDGSASFVPWNEMIIIPQANRFKLYYQP